VRLTSTHRLRTVEAVGRAKWQRHGEQAGGVALRPLRTMAARSNGQMPDSTATGAVAANGLTAVAVGDNGAGRAALPKAGVMAQPVRAVSRVAVRLGVVAAGQRGWVAVLQSSA
jgi:ABC-type Fe3+ transport system substrate-binding protein